MKKLIGTVAVAALLASAAFAELNFSAWLNNLSAVVASDGDEIRAGVANPWGAARSARFNLSYVSDDEKFGMETGVYVEPWVTDPLKPAGNNHMWVRPWDWLKVSVGSFDDNNTGLRSDLCLPDWNWLRPNNYISAGEGITFSDIAGNGLRLQLFPVEGLQIAALIPVSPDFDAAKDIYNKMQIAAGYTIGDIGTIKLGWWGKSETDVENEFDVAFDLTAIDGMFLTVGTKLTITDDSDNNDYLVAVGWRYNFTDTFALLLDASAKFYGDSDIDPVFGAAVGVNVGFTDALNLDAEVRWLHAGEDADSISFLVGLNYFVSSNGVLGIGFEGITKGQGFCYGGALTYSDAFAWAVPIKVSIWF